MLESRRLRYFIAVAEELHFGRAADKLGVAQSALSRHIKEFEQSLGVRLLNRGRRSIITLTEPGKAFFQDAMIGVNQLERAENAAHRAARGEIGGVAVGYVASAALSGVLPRALELFRVKHTEVSVQITAMETPKQLAALRDGLIDVGFLRPRGEYPSGVSAAVVHREAMLLAIAANHPLSSKRIGLKALMDQTFIIPQFDENTGFAEQLAQLCSHGGFEPKKILHVRDFITAITMAAGGYGVVPVPRCMLSINMRNIIFKPIHGYSGFAELAVAYRGRQASAAVMAFVDEVLQAHTD
jgi:LysR family transcriptional regulator, benzoate and cis,cis-muconate-responsive activator of ben and cat genes